MFGQIRNASGGVEQLQPENAPSLGTDPPPYIE
jgi:hypothetical protein